MRRHLLTLTALLLTLGVPLLLAAATTLPHTFTNGALADADEVNANFAALATAIDSKDQIPAGAVMYFAGASCPAGWLKANGASLSAAAYPALSTALGTTYGGSGGNFNLPDLRGVFPRGHDDGRNLDPSRAFGSYQDMDFKSFSLWNHNPSSSDYSHGEVYIVKSGISGNLFGGQWDNPSGKIQVKWDGSEIRPRNVALRACIKL